MYDNLLKQFGYRATQGYGRTQFAITSGIYPNQFHDGRDYTYTNIKNNACKVLASGKITYVGFGGRYGRAYGNIVEMEIAPNTFLAYCHLDRFLPLAKVGDNRVVGDDIAIIGKSGTSLSTGIHVHLLARKNGKTIDPKELVDNPQAQALFTNLPTNNNDMSDQEIKVMLIAITRQYNRGDIFNPKNGAWIDINHYLDLYKRTPEKDIVIDTLFQNIDDIKRNQGISKYNAKTRNWEV